jgi:hypothetical protein
MSDINGLSEKITEFQKELDTALRETEPEFTGQRWMADQCFYDNGNGLSSDIEDIVRGAIQHGADT